MSSFRRVPHWRKGHFSSVSCVYSTRCWLEGRKGDGHGPLQVLWLSPHHTEWGSRLRKRNVTAAEANLPSAHGSQNGRVTLMGRPDLGILPHVTRSKQTEREPDRKARSSEDCFMVIVTKETNSLVFMCSAHSPAESLRLRWYHRIAQGIRRDGNSQTGKYGSCLRICQSFSHHPWCLVALKLTSLWSPRSLKSDQELVLLLHLCNQIHILATHWGGSLPTGGVEGPCNLGSFWGNHYCVKKGPLKFISICCPYCRKPSPVYLKIEVANVLLSSSRITFSLVRMGKY